MQIELNTSAKTIRLQEKVKLIDLLEFLTEHNLEIEDWSLDIYYNKPYLYPNIIGYPSTGVTPTSNTTHTDLKDMNVTYTK